MKEVFIVHGRVESIVSEWCDQINFTEEIHVYGVYDAFDTALLEFKKLVRKAKRSFLREKPIIMTDEWIEIS